METTFTESALVNKLHSDWKEADKKLAYLVGSHFSNKKLKKYLGLLNVRWNQYLISYSIFWMSTANGHWHNNSRKLFYSSSPVFSSSQCKIVSEVCALSGMSIFFKRSSGKWSCQMMNFYKDLL